VFVGKLLDDAAPLDEYVVNGLFVIVIDVHAVLLIDSRGDSVILFVFVVVKYDEYDVIGLYVIYVDFVKDQELREVKETEIVSQSVDE
jgi:hypothetical protein